MDEKIRKYMNKCPELTSKGICKLGQTGIPLFCVYEDCNKMKDLEKEAKTKKIYCFKCRKKTRFYKTFSLKKFPKLFINACEECGDSFD